MGRGYPFEGEEFSSQDIVCGSEITRFECSAFEYQRREESLAGRHDSVSTCAFAIVPNGRWM